MRRQNPHGVRSWHRMMGPTIPLLFAFLTSPVQAEESWTVDLQDYNECDEFFCPSGSQSGFQTQIQRQTGIVLAPTASGEAAPGLVIRPLGTGPSPRPAIRPSNTPPPVASSVADGGQGQEAAGGAGQANPQGTGQGSFSGASAPGTGMGFSGGSTNPNVRGGLLYASDDPSSPIKPTESALGGNKNNPQALSAVERNRMQMGLPTGGSPSAKSSGQGEGAVGAGGFGAGLPPGQDGLVGGSNGSGSAGAGGSAESSESFLEKIAKGLGLDNFFGVGGAGRRSGGPGDPGGPGAQGRRGGPGSAGNKALVDPRTVLQRQFDQWKNRNLASQLEFAPAGSSLFTNMCQHYQSYARNNRMPASRLPCQEQR